MSICVSGRICVCMCVLVFVIVLHQSKSIANHGGHGHEKCVSE